MKKSPLLIFLAFACGYFMSFALRSVNAVLAPELVREFGLSNSQLGALSSAYFFAFALMQLPLGVLLDRFGPRRTNAALLCVAALGSVVFAVASGFASMWLGRAMIGVGVAGALMASLSAYRFSFPPERQQQLAAWMLMAGSFGALATTLPVRWGLPLIGWRPMFGIAALMLVLASLAILAWVPERHGAAAKSTDRKKGAALAGGVDESLAAPGAGVSAPAVGSVAAYRFVMGKAFFWRFGLVSIFLHGSFVAFQSLWSGPWLMQVSGLSPTASASVLMLLNFVLMLGFLGVGLVAPRIEPHRIAGLTALACLLVILVQFLMILVPMDLGATTQGLGAALWVLMALVSVPFTLIQPHVCLSFSQTLTGRAYAAYNLLIFVGVFLAQWLFGVVADLFKLKGLSSGQSLRMAMAVWASLELLSVLIFIFWPFQREAEAGLAGQSVPARQSE